MTNPQTEARAIVDTSLPPHEQAALGHDAIVVLTEAIATALAAKNAELAAYRQSSVHPDDYEAVKAQLAEARKAHSTILAVLGNVEHRGGGPNAARMYADMLNDIREIARRALTGGKVDG